MGLLAMLIAVSGTAEPMTAHPTEPIILRTRHIEWAIGPDGRNLRFAERRTGRDHLNRTAGSVPFFVRIGSETRVATRVERSGERLTAVFGDDAVRAELTVRETPDAVVMEVVSVTGPVDELTFGQVMLSPTETLEACTLARNVITNVPELPGRSSILRAMAYRRLGFAGASAAFVTAPRNGLRKALQRVVATSPDLPRSPIGGPWAMDSPPNRRSYLFNFGDLNAASAGPWIELAHALGAGQVDFHGGTSFRFGDFLPNPQTYPNGLADLKATVDALHAAGLQAGLHTYAFFLDKRSKYVTPVPDPRLASARSFTLAEPLGEADDTITVQESTAGVHATTGFFVTNSATLRIGTELVTFREATQEPPYRFLGCTRGALGTRPQAHAAGEKADHLKELFGLFAPDAESDLFTEIIENTAQTYNACGFDMIYLDALDGSYIHAGPEWAWHYGARFVYELVKRLNKPAIMEMSTFHHHLWCVRARMGAWDAARTGYKEFVDMHRVVNRDCERMYLPSHLGWWGVFPWNGVQPTRTLSDDLEYLLCKALADDAGVSFVQGFAPNTFPTSPGAQRYARLIKSYEDLRRSGAVPPSLRKRLGEPQAEFRLLDGPKGKRAFVPVRYEKVRAEASEASAVLRNPYASQPLSVRIEAKLSVGDDRSVPPLLDAAAVSTLAEPRSAEGVQLKVSVTEHDAPAPNAPRASLTLRASSSRAEPRGAWAMVDRVLPAPVDMTRKGLGVWVHGDGRGAVLNIQLRNADNVTPGVAEHYIVLDFIGWRYCEIVEPENERLSLYSWPYAGRRDEWERNPGLAFTSAYKTYHPWVVYSQIHAVSVWLNEIPAGGEVECRIGSIAPIPLADATVERPSISVGDRTLTFPVELTSGQYLELGPDGDATVYGPQNEPLRTVKPEGDRPTLRPGDNALRFRCNASGSVRPRATITVILRDRPIRF